jgi:hypothetical protein
MMIIYSLLALSHFYPSCELGLGFRVQSVGFSFY